MIRHACHRCASRGTPSLQVLIWQPPHRQLRSSSAAAVPKWDVTDSQISSQIPSFPSSFGRLHLDDHALDSVLRIGRSEGPLKAYTELVNSGSIELDAAQLRCAEILQNQWTQLSQGKAVHGSYGCYIWGSVGTGKSLLVDLFAESCMLKVRRLHFHEFMETVHRRMQSLRQSGAEDKSTRAVAKSFVETGIDVFVFDEFNITNISDALIVETLLTFLFESGIFIVLSTNRPPKDLYKHGLNRDLAIPQLLALFERRGITVHEVKAARDFRQGDVSARGEFRDFIFHGCGADDRRDAEKQIRQMFAEASQTRTADTVSQQVKIAWGRSIKVSAVSGSVARFTFSELCGGNPALCADDYLHLALQFHTIVMTDVPRVEVDMHNEARRFTNLIDCLYEQHTRLIISSETPLPELLADMEAFAGFSLDEFHSLQMPDREKRVTERAENYLLRKMGWEEERTAAAEAPKGSRHDKWMAQQRERADAMTKVIESLQAAAPTGTRGGHATRRNWVGDDSNSTGAGAFLGSNVWCCWWFDGERFCCAKGH
eukprot:gnl/TRDRNA2_/TRDRNA2_94345_c0_seq1.p1 gnl/TRDRNA2_/TRDRNA2_94345_c0~~gnl/TRDRNA2_/TRDRNA2_94345_c0_seq1.p1  ORF type:complete len:559 (-),score=48.63 gnl/TRDRNA2_/TRDRNA2_94345_c0_seq1:14-1642(-)